MKNRHLWLKISAAGLPEGFVDKVRDEFSWSPDETSEAIEEYRRFVYLNQIAEHPLSPPREVDLVWHMHLLFTRHYWGAWDTMLETPVHHEPAKPRTAEKAFWGPYGQTRELYLQEFDDFAQAKIWPSLETLKKRQRAGWFVLLCVVLFIIGIIGGVTTKHGFFGILCVVSFVCIFVGLFMWGTKNGGGSSFGVSSGSGGGDGCGD